ncbi:MAG TPA: hypothetical protein VMU45_01115 [Candidatus Eisenbacteria bacterium]|nr:hypothetical protein [Candidatus Eisenbacteria bacterium]
MTIEELCQHSHNTVPDAIVFPELGHANVSTTNTYYIKTAPQQVTDAMAKLEQALPDSLSVN